MAVTPEQVGVEIGVPTPSDSQTAQWQSWIDQGYYLIERRYGVDYTNPSTADADYVVLMVVAAHARHPDSSTQVDVSVDDASMSRRYTTSAGRVMLDDWWDFLDPDPTTGGAFTITPYGEPDVAYADVAFDWRAALATDD